MASLTRFGRGVGVFGSAFVLVTSALIAACSSDDSASSPISGAPTGPEASSSAQPESPPAPPGASEDLITAGGGVPLEDPAAGAEDDDAGIDAGPACGLVAVGAYSATTCSNRASTLGGGDLTTTTYELKSVTVLASATFCTNSFVPYEHRGGLKVTASSASAAKFEYFDQYRKAGTVLFPTRYRYDAQVVASGAELGFTPSTCAPKPAPAKGSYAVGTDDKGKKELVMRLPYGKGYALYRFVEP